MDKGEKSVPVVSVVRERLSRRRRASVMCNRVSPDGFMEARVQGRKMVTTMYKMKDSVRLAG